MVQLRSFRYFESGTTGRDELGDELSTSNRSSSSPPVSIVAGGNLTSESSSAGGSGINRRASFRSSTEQAHREVGDAGSVEDSTTLSSSQEYQIANLDIQDEDEHDERKDTKGASVDEKLAEDAKRVAQNLHDATPKPEKEPNTDLKLANNPQSAQRPHLIGSQSTPVSLRGNNNSAGQSPSINAIHRHYNRQQSPQMRFAAGGRQPGNGQNDNLSRPSSQVFSSQQISGNHFEVRWRNLNLHARRSKVPKLIAENPIYKLLKRGKPNEQEADDRMYYSPPIKHKSSLHQLDAPMELEMAGRSGPMDPKASSTGKPSMEQWMSEQQCSAGPEYRCVLANINGSVFSGQLTAVLGPSGVGKTMLLNSLTGRNTLDGTGRVQLLGGASKRMSVVTVPQADILPGKLTALEDLQFTSRIKNPQRNFDHERNVGRIVRHLHMQKFLHTRIDKLSGGEARRLSIGRELLSSPDIMILDEPTSGLDANTCKKIITVLRDIVEHSDNYLDRPMSIIITIHQPQQEVLNLFHRAYVIALGGRAIYEGAPSDLMSTLLEQSSLSRVCPIEQLNENPAIVALEVASGEYGPNVIAELALYHESQAYNDEASIYDMDEVYGAGSPWTPRQLRKPRKSPLSASPHFDLIRKAQMNHSGSPLGSRHTPMMAAVANKQRLAAQMDHVSNVTSVSYCSTYDAYLPEQTSRLKVDKRLRRSVVMKGDFISHTLTLMKRCWLLTTRDRFLMSIRVIGFLLVAGGTVQIFSHALDPNEHQCPAYQSEVDDISGYMMETKKRMLGLQRNIQQFSSTLLFFFHLILCLTMVVSALSGLVFPIQMRMFLRERKNGWYSPTSFITSITLAELPIDMIGPVLTLLIVYPLSNQPSSEYHWREAGYMIIAILSSVICKSVAQIVGALLMDSVENSVFISCVAATPSALLSGLAVRVSSMSKPLQLLSYGSFLRYNFEAFFVIRYGYGICPCDPEIIHGYPIKTTFEAIPPQLDRLARGFIELNTPSTSSPPAIGVPNSTDSGGESTALDGNLFVKFIELVTDSSNRFVPNPSQMGDCSSYRSLALMDTEIEDNVLPKYLFIMVSMFIISRFITYFVVKLVIRLKD